MAGTELNAAVQEGVVHPVQELVPSVHREDVRRGYDIAKRALDLLVATVLCVLALPLFLVIAALVRLTSRGPVLLRQTRCGQDGREFTCLKFRTMINGAHARRDSVLHLNQMSGPVFKIRNDPRCTGVGRWLRRLSLDEMPQLLNVVRGDMSLVGPRPPLPAEVAQYTPYQRGRLQVKPGLTGLWQISGRADIDFDQWVELDLEYIRRRSMWLDCWILLCTIPAVLSMRGAY